MFIGERNVHQSDISNDNNILHCNKLKQELIDIKRLFLYNSFYFNFIALLYLALLLIFLCVRHFVQGVQTLTTV